VTKLITAYVGDVPAAISQPFIATYEKQYASPYVAFSGGRTDKPQTYIRLHGPPVCVQTTDKGSSHDHFVYRDKLHDNGR